MERFRRSRTDLTRRAENFGSFVWSRDRTSFFKLVGFEAMVFELFYAEARSIEPHPSDIDALRCAGYSCSIEDWASMIAGLTQSGLLQDAKERAAGTTTEAREKIARLVESQPKAPIAKPVWAHLQPFLFCNLACTHCYCNSSPRESAFLLDLERWTEIITKLDRYGIAEVYVTGGETLLLDETWELVDEIQRRGMGTGLSTNALSIDGAMLDRIVGRRINRIQVSLDGGTAETHDRIRAKPGAFVKTLRGIERLASVTTPVINTVVCSANVHELENIVRLGLDRGIVDFKFFPQKAVGRGRGQPNQILSDAAIDGLVVRCRLMAAAHGVRIETVSDDVRCGSARSGFSIDQVGDAYPCIFGIADPSQRAGSLLDGGDIDEIWFESEPMRRFRAIDRRPCHVCEHRTDA